MRHPSCALFVFSLYISLIVGVQNASAATKQANIQKSVHAIVASKRLASLQDSRRSSEQSKPEIKQSISKCLTPVMRTLRQKVVTQFQKDGVAHSVSTTTAGELGDAYRVYLSDVDVMWAAMYEPYCGYGSHGMTAIRRSYEKNAVRVREQFLRTAKQISQKQKAASSTTSTVEGS